MKIVILKKYRHKFKDNNAYVSRWKNRSILVTNQKIKNQFEKSLKEEKNKVMRMSLRLFVRGLTEVKIDKDGIVQIPKRLIINWLGKGNPHCKKGNMGIVVNVSKTK